MKNYKLFAFAVLTILSLLLASCAPAAPATEAPAVEVTTAPAAEQQPEKLKVALVHYGVFTDKSWGQGAYEGFMKAVEENDLEYATTEMLPQGEWESTFRDYASKGFDLVVGTDSGMDEAAKVVGEEYPDTFFLTDSGRYANGKNVGSIAIAEWQEGYLGGTVMAMLTKAKKIGFIGGTDHPVITAVATGIKATAAEIDPEIEVMESYVGSWTDVQKAKELASAMLDAGADYIMPKADAGSVAAIEVAAERGAYAVGSTGDMTSVDPEHVVASARARNDEAVYRAVSLFADGKLTPEVLVWGVAEGVVDIVWNPKFQEMYPEVYDATMKVMEDLKSGAITEPK